MTFWIRTGGRLRFQQKKGQSYKKEMLIYVTIGHHLLPMISKLQSLPLTNIFRSLLYLATLIVKWQRRDKFNIFFTILVRICCRFFVGFPMEIYAIADGRVLSYILDPNFENYLPVIPSEVSS